MIATWLRTMWPVLASSIRLDIFVNSYGLRRYQVTNKRCVGISGSRFVCPLTEKVMGKQQAEGKRVKTSVCTRATIIKEAQSQG